MLSLKDLLFEKINLKINKGITISFSEYKGHTLADKLERANITDAEFKSVLNQLTKKIKTEKLDSGNYAFIFKKFKLATRYDKSRKELTINTILTATMKPKKEDIIFIMEKVEYILIYMY